jgi:hypothetical protein
MTMIKYLKLPFHFDAQRLQEEAGRLNGPDWKLHYQTMHYEGDWKAIPLRSVGGQSGDIIISPLNDAAYEDTVFLDHCNYIKEILSFFRCPLMAVRLLKLNTGGVIKEHRDAELNFEKGEVRIHIPVRTDEKVEFFLDKERIYLQEGECWYMNFNLPHYINNFSDIDRVHLVIDAKVNDWVKELFAGENITVKKEISEPDPHDAAAKKLMIERFRAMGTETGDRLADELEKQLSADC